MTATPSITNITEAAANGQLAITKSLIPTASQEQKNEALSLAVGGGHLEVIRELVNAGAKKESITDEDYRAAADFSTIPPREIRKFVDSI